MNEEQLKTTLQYYYENYSEIGVCVYALLKDTDYRPFKLDLSNEAEPELRNLFIQSLRDKITDKDDLSVLNLSSADERTNTIYVYDLEIPNELSSLEMVISQDNLPILDLNERSLSSIKALLIEIGNNEQQLVLYKTMAPINIFGRASFFLRKSKSRLEKLDDEFLRVSPGFQMLRVGGELFVLELESLEHSFGFHDVIKREAVLSMNAITSAQLIANPEVLHELIDDVKYARRLTKIAKSSPVLKAGISGESIVKFCNTYPMLKGRIKFNDEKTKVVLDTKVSKDLFIKVLMDDFLTSELTTFHYASIAKDAVDQIVEEK